MAKICDSCYYYCREVGSCDYCEITGHRRESEPDEHCRRYKPGMRKNPAMTIILPGSRQRRTRLASNPDREKECMQLYRQGLTTGAYGKGTLGELNGMNNVTAPLPDTIEEIEKLLRTTGSIKEAD